MKKKIIIGILGGIGCGKSTVAACFAKLGCMVIDADAIAHAVLNEPEIIGKITDRWGAGIIGANGLPNRSRIAETVFESKEETDFINNLIHPRVLRKCRDKIDMYRNDPQVRAIVLDMPLLLEAGWEKKCDFLVFVECSEEKRAERIARNGNIDIEQLKKRENFQISLDKKIAKAHYRVNNNSDKSDLAEQVALIFSNMTGSR